MFGRAGRNGGSARAHLIYKAKQSKDKGMELFCEAKENCRRAEMLKYLGSSEIIIGGTECCDICSKGEVPYSRLDVLSPTQLKRVRKPCAE